MLAKGHKGEGARPHRGPIQTGHLRGRFLSLEAKETKDPFKQSQGTKGERGKKKKN